MEVLGALASVLSIWLVTGILVYEAVNRMINPEPVNGKSVLLTKFLRQILLSQMLLTALNDQA